MCIRDSNKVVQKYIDQGVAELIPGVLFIDEVNMLDIEIFTYLNRALESSIAPVVILASNRGMTTIRGTGDDVKYPHGCPPDLIDRLLIVKTLPYNQEEIKTIISKRAQLEGLVLAPEALEKLSQHGVSSSLRYALQLLAPAGILAKTANRSEIIVDDVEECETLFLDGRRSMAVLQGSKGFL